MKSKMARISSQEWKTIAFNHGPFDGVKATVTTLPTEIVLDFQHFEHCPRFIRDEKQPGIRIRSSGTIPARYIADFVPESGEYRYQFMPEQRAEPVDLWGFTNRERDEARGADDES